MGVTPKQRAFAAKVIEGKNPSAAYRETYDASGMNPSSVAHEANELMNHPNVSPIIQRGIEESMQGAIWCRSKAIEQLQAVNRRCFETIVNGDSGAPDKTALTGFLETVDRLNELCPVAIETADAKSTFKADPERLKRVQDEARRTFESEVAAIVG